MVSRAAAIIPVTSFIVTILALSSSALLTWGVLRLARSRGLLDHPNERSSHHIPTPRGGGTAIVLVTLITLVVLVVLGKISWRDFSLLAVGGGAVALVGLIDDFRKLSTHLRLSVHFGAGVWAMLCLDGLAPIQIGDLTISLGWAGYPLGVLGIVWCINLFNFMDGIDGLACSEGAFFAIGGVLLLGSNDLSTGVALMGWALGGACLGFMVWNWPPARIFLGDVGSGFLGYFLVCLALIMARDCPIALFVFVILGAIFVVDATVTFLRRIARGERYDVGHRTHGYQRLARRWGSHLPVTLSVWAVNLGILFPAAGWSVRNPSWAAYVAASVLVLLTGVAVIVGSGRQEEA